jgi:hypothetical protein
MSIQNREKETKGGRERVFPTVSAWSGIVFEGVQFGLLDVDPPNNAKAPAQVIIPTRCC